jgi:hypothetical protein
MELEVLLLERVGNWATLSRWERSELGRDLRRAGLSYGEIMDLVPVKKSTLATWCRDIRLTEMQIEAIKVRHPPPRGAPRNTQRRRHQMVALIEAQATLEAIHLQDDPFWCMGIALYWAEGSKTNRRLEMAHSEPEALRLYMVWARRFLQPDAEFAGAINLHSDNDEPGARMFWSRELGIPLENFTKTFIKPDGTGHRKNHLPHGVCRATMRRSTDAWITTLAWVNFIKEGFSN